MTLNNNTTYNPEETQQTSQVNLTTNQQEADMLENSKELANNMYHFDVSLENMLAQPMGIMNEGHSAKKK